MMLNYYRMAMEVDSTVAVGLIIEELNYNKSLRQHIDSLCNGQCELSWREGVARQVISSSGIDSGTTDDT